MGKSNTRSKSKQGQANNKPAGGAPVKKTGAVANGTTAKATGGLSNGASAKTTTSSAVTEAASSKAASTASTTQKAATTQQKPRTAGTMPSTGGAAKQADFSGRSTSKSVKQQRKQQKIQNRLVQQRQDARQRRTTIILVAAVFVVAAGLLTWLLISNAVGTQGHTVFNPDYPPIDGVYCDQLEQTAYHHHVLLTVYIDGQQVSVPAGVGLAGNASSPTCYYWLHTHDTTGIVHIEAPSGGSYTLKDFLDVWQNFANSSSTIIYPSQLASSSGWTVYINGKKVNDDFSHIDISSDSAWHELITIMYNSPSAKPVTTYSWPSGY